jgi:hypothetical protein
MKSVFVVAIFGGLIACGDNHHNTPDAPPLPPDAPIDAPKPPPDGAAIVCDYDEQHDTTNDVNQPPMTAVEDTGLTFSGATISICGMINTGSAHFDTNFDTIDDDNFGFTVAADTDVLVALTAPPANYAAMNAISNLQLIFFNVQTSATIVTSWASPSGDHAMLSAHVPAGSYQVTMNAADNQNSPTVTGPALPYAITISADQPSVRCQTFAGSANATEGSTDGAANDLNDIIQIDGLGRFSLISPPVPGSAPVATGLSLQPSTDYLITGDSAAVTTGHQTYWDMDTYSVTAGSNTNQLSVRLDWGSGAANLDYYLYEPNPLSAAEIANPSLITASTSAPEEFGTAAVSPGVTYYISVGESSPQPPAAPAPAVDAPYSLTVCAESFVPPPN